MITPSLFSQFSTVSSFFVALSSFDGFNVTWAKNISSLFSLYVYCSCPSHPRIDSSCKLHWWRLLKSYLSRVTSSLKQGQRILFDCGNCNRRMSTNTLTLAILWQSGCWKWQRITVSWWKMVPCVPYKERLQVWHLCRCSRLCRPQKSDFTMYSWDVMAPGLYSWNTQRMEFDIQTPVGYEDSFNGINLTEEINCSLQRLG